VDANDRITGAEFAAVSDDQLLEQLPQIGVVARVAPEDKLRLVRLLKRSGAAAPLRDRAPGEHRGDHDRPAAADLRDRREEEEPCSW
jgi:hypothetical protein